MTLTIKEDEILYFSYYKMYPFQKGGDETSVRLVELRSSWGFPENKESSKFKFSPGVNGSHNNSGCHVDSCSLNMIGMSFCY